MSRIDRECPACGKRVLPIATRCPGCAYELPPAPTRGPVAAGSGRPGLVPGAALILLLALGVSALVTWRMSSRGKEMASAPAPVAEPAAPLGTTRSAATAVLPDSAPSAEAMPRVAKTWTKVRARRSVTGEVVAVLLPGDTVLADSLRSGWWRVALEGKVLGYSYAGTLAGR